MRVSTVFDAMFKNNWPEAGTNKNIPSRTGRSHVQTSRSWRRVPAASSAKRLRHTRNFRQRLQVNDLQQVVSIPNAQWHVQEQLGGGEREMARRCTTRGSTQERGHSGSLLSMKLQDCQEHIDESLEPIKMGKEDFLFYLKIIQPLWKDKKRI